MSGCDRLNILAFEPFDGGSHRAVRESISQHSRHCWRWRTRPARAWKWRMRLAAIELLEEAERDGSLATSDVLFVTSLMSVADLRALLPEPKRHLPIILYLHENQAAYPPSEEQNTQDRQRDAHFALTNLTSILAADRVIWNSRFNQDSFVEGIGRLLRSAPDLALRDLEPSIRARSEVIWPPVEGPPEACDRTAERVLHKPVGPIGPVRVLWPHRWEHDKGPAELLELALTLSEPLDLRWTILGQRYRQVPAELEVFHRQLRGRIDHFGYEPDRAAYWRHVSDCDWVLSTARHEFFGIAVVEAMLAGCLPWLPSRLSYPELLPPCARDLSPARPPDPEGDDIRRQIAEHLQPARAPAAVAKIDRVVERTVGRCG